MKPKTMILMVVAIGCGLGASYMTSKLLADRRQTKEEDKVIVVVAKKKVPRFTVLKDPDKFFEAREMPKSAAPRSFFTDLNEIKGKRVNKEIKTDVHISEEDVQKATAALPIPDGGYVALGVTVTAASTAGYFVSPGDKVDIILTQRGPNASSQNILRDVLVLAVGDRVVKEDGSAALPAGTVSVAVFPDEAKLLRLSETQGELSLLLRKDGEPGKGTGKVVTLRDLKRVGVIPLETVASRPGSGEHPPAETELPTIKKPAKQDPPKETVKKDPPKETVKQDRPRETVKKDPPKDLEEDTEPEKIKPVWTVTIESGASAPKKVHFYKRPDGSVTKDESDPDLADSESKKKKKTDPKKSATK